MENNNQNINTGQKGVFPGSHIPNQPVINEYSQLVESAISSANQNATGAQNINIEVPSADAPEAKTFMKLETKNPDGQVSGVIEIDLISFREKGQESRYLSINTLGAGQDGVQSETIISINNEMDFKKLKDFISNLNWND